MQELFQSMLEVTELRELKDVACPWEEAVFIAQSCPTLCDPMDCSPPGSSPMGFSKQEYRSGLLFPSPGHLPDSGIEHGSPAFQADTLTSEPPGKPCFREVHTVSVLYCAHYCMKCSLGISNSLEKISSLSHSIVLLYFFTLFT